MLRGVSLFDSVINIDCTDEQNQLPDSLWRVHKVNFWLSCECWWGTESESSGGVIWPCNRCYLGGFSWCHGKRLFVSHSHLLFTIFYYFFFCVCELLKSKLFPQLIVFANYLWKSNYLPVMQFFGKAFFFLIGKEESLLYRLFSEKKLFKYCSWCITLDTSDWVASAVLRYVTSPR